MMSCSLSAIEQNGARPSYWRIVASWSRRPVRILCGYAWWPTSQRILSRGESSRLCRTTASSQVPRLAPKWPPISPITSITNSRTSCAIRCSSSSERPCRSAGDWIDSSRDVLSGALTATQKAYGAGAPGSGLAGVDEIRDELEVARLPGNLRERPPRLRVRFRGELTGSLEAEQADVGDLAVPFVGTVRLAQLCIGARHVEDVIDDLEEHPQLIREGAIGALLSRADPGQSQGNDDARGDQTTGLQGMQASQTLGVEVIGRGHVDVLAADHPPHARGPKELRQRGNQPIGLALLPLAEDAQRLSEEAVSGQDRDAFA